MKPDALVANLAMSEQFFNRSTDVLTEEDSGFRPIDGAWTVAHQVAHSAQTIDWFIDGSRSPEGFDMDFPAHAQRIAAVQSLSEARKWLKESYATAREYFGGMSETQLARRLPEGPVMGGAPISDCAMAIVEHTAHHRGALTVYSRLLGKTPAMPYM